MLPALGLFAYRLESGITHRWKDKLIYFHESLETAYAQLMNSMVEKLSLFV